MPLLSVSSLISLPVTYLFFENFVLIRFLYHTPAQVAEMFMGLLGIFLIAFIMIGSQTIRAAKINPAEVLKAD